MKVFPESGEWELTRQDNSNLKLLLVGPCPPPYGGIAMTIFDLHRYLIAKNVGDVRVLNIGEGRFVPSDQYLQTRGAWDYFTKVFGFAARGYTIHLETNGHNLKSWMSAFVCAAAGLLNRRKTVIAFGSGNLPVYVTGMNGWVRIIARAVLRWAGVVICRNDSMVRALRDVGESSRIEVVPGFMGLIGRTTASPPPAVEEFCRTHEPLIGATVNLDPEYGVPLALQAVGHLCSRFPRVGLVLIGLDHSAAESLPDLADVREHVLLPGTLSPDVTLGVMKRLGVFLRPTYFDGDSVSVREALALGIPVVASDTGFRPEGVHRFKVGDRLDLCERLEAVLVMAGGEHERRQGAIQPEGHAPTIVALYRQL